VKYIYFKINQSTASLSVGAKDRPGNFTQYFAWIAKFAKKLDQHTCSWFGIFMLGFMETQEQGLF
jgi:hypothetical protein